MVQDAVIPDTMHGTSPEVVELTKRKLDIEDELSDAGSRVQELEVEATRQKAQMMEAMERLEELADNLPSYDEVNNITATRVVSHHQHISTVLE